MFVGPADYGTPASQQFPAVSIYFQIKSTQAKYLPKNKHFLGEGNRTGLLQNHHFPPPAKTETLPFFPLPQ
jgi:hypothetical protein